MLLSTGGKPPPRGKGAIGGGIHSSSLSHQSIGGNVPGAPGNVGNGNVSAAYGGVKASKPLSSVTPAVTSTHLNNNNSNNNNNNNHDEATTAGSGKAGYTQWVVSAAKDLAVTYSTSTLPWAAPWTMAAKTRPVGNDGDLLYH